MPQTFHYCLRELSLSCGDEAAARDSYVRGTQLVVGGKAAAGCGYPSNFSLPNGKGEGMRESTSKALARAKAGRVDIVIRDAGELPTKTVVANYAYAST